MTVMRLYPMDAFQWELTSDDVRKTLFPDGFDPEWMEQMICCKRLDENEWLSVIPLTLGRARICVCESGRTGNASIEHWCVDSPFVGFVQWLLWPNAPTMWNRHQKRDLTHEYPVG